MLRIHALHLPIQARTTHAHTRVRTHTWAAIYAAALWEQLRVQCHAQGHLSRGNEGGESAVHSLCRDCPPKIPAGPRLELDYESDSLPLGHNFTSMVAWENGC